MKVLEPKKRLWQKEEVIKLTASPWVG